MKIIEVNLSNNHEKFEFVHFPFHLYQDNPYWVPPIQSELKTVMNPSKHPYYKHSDAKFFLAIIDNEIVGRLAALFNKNYAQFHNDPVGFFYYFESINNQEVVNKLFDRAKYWFKQVGVNKIIGPKGFLRSNGFGVLVKGFDYLPAVSIPYNMPYYDVLLTNYGFKKFTDHMSGYLYVENQLPDKLHMVADKVREKSGFWVKSFNSRKEMVPWIPKIDKLHFDAFHNNPNFYPSTSEEFQFIAKNILDIASPK